MALQDRSARVAVTGVHAELARTFAEVVNVSRTGALVRAGQQHAPGDVWPIVLDVGRRPVHLVARVVRCERVTPPRSVRVVYALGLAFVDPSDEARSELDRVCVTRAAGARGGLSISLARRCPYCRSRAVAKEGRGHYLCTACRRRFHGFKLGFIRIAR